MLSRVRGRRRTPPALAAFWVRVTVNPAPSAATDDVVAIGWLEPLIMVIGSARAWARFRSCPFWVAEALVKATLPKSASGTIPPRPLGASSTHSADEWVELY